MPALTTAQKLTQAEQAYHELLTGQSVRVFIDQNGERVEYNAARKDDLYSYIVSLGGPSVKPAVVLRRPLTFTFGARRFW